MVGGPTWPAFSSGSQRVLIYGREAQAEPPPWLPGRAWRVEERPLLSREWARPAAALMTLLLQRQPDPGSLRFLEPARSVAAFPALKAGAAPLLHSRKIFAQGLGTRRRGNKSHLGAARAVCLPLHCCRGRGLPSGAGPGNPTPHTGQLSVCASRSGVTVGSEEDGASRGPGTALGPGCRTLALPF